MSEQRESGPMSGAEMTADISQHLLETMRSAYRRQRMLAERALAQLLPADWHVRLDPESNSVAIIVRHMAGNMHSRWTDFLVSDGEKPERDREGEFRPGEQTPEALTEEWDDAWDVTLATIDALEPDDLLRVVTIRGQPLSVAEALVRQLDHYGQHVGQIIFLAKHLRGGSWRSLSIPTPPRER